MLYCRCSSIFIFIHLFYIFLCFIHCPVTFIASKHLPNTLASRLLGLCTMPKVHACVCAWENCRQFQNSLSDHDIWKGYAILDFTPATSGCKMWLSLLAILHHLPSVKMSLDDDFKNKQIYIARHHYPRALLSVKKEGLTSTSKLFSLACGGRRWAAPHC